MVDCKLQDQLGDAFFTLAQVAGPAGCIHVLVEVEDESRLAALAPHARALSSLGEVSLTVRRREKIRRAPLVVRWVIPAEEGPP